MLGELDLQLLDLPGISWRGRELKPPSARSLPLLAYVAVNTGITTRQDLVRLLWLDGRLVNLRQELKKIRDLPGAKHWFDADAQSGGRVSATVASDVTRL